MEPAPGERDDTETGGLGSTGYHAAMEPAPGERDDRVLPAPTSMMSRPQWSPLLVSGMTPHAGLIIHPVLVGAAMEPAPGERDDWPSRPAAPASPARRNGARSW